MYTIEEREELFNKTIEFFRSLELFEGVVQIGSGTIGYRDEYSDIDLMAAYYSNYDAKSAQNAVINFFEDLGASYMNNRKWTDTILGVSVYFRNGLGMDISFGPTDELIVCSPQWKVVFDKTGKLTKCIEEENDNFIKHLSNYGIDDSIHHNFIYALRRFNIAMKRENYIYATNMLNTARQYVIDIEVLNEGKKVHEFSAYNTLDCNFQTEIIKTFPPYIYEDALNEARNQLFQLYFDVIDKSKNLDFDERLLVLLVD